MAATLPELALRSSVLEPPDTPTASGAFVPPERPQVLDTLTDTIGKLSIDYGGKREALETAEKATQKKHDELIPPAVERLKKAAEAPLPEAPATSPEPPMPDLSPRAFLGGEGKNALQQVIQGLGLIVTSIAGARRAPAAALGALTGAMTGWAEGDAERVSRDWHRYEGLVAKMNRENAMAFKQYEMATAQWGMDQEAAKVFLQAKLAELGLTEYAAHLAEKGYQRTGQDLAAEMGIYSKISSDYNALLGKKLDAWKAGETQRHNQAIEASLTEKAKHADAALKELKRYHDGLLELKKTGPAAKLNEHRRKIAEGIEKLTEKNRGLDESLLMVDELEKAVTLLDAKGVIPKGASYVDEAKAHVALQTSVGDADVADALQTLKRFGTASIIRKELEMMGGKGAGILRLKAIGEAEAGSVLMNPKPWWDRFLTDSRRILNGSKQMNGPVMKAYQESLKALGPSPAEIEAPTSTPPPEERDILTDLGFQPEAQ